MTKNAILEVGVETFVTAKLDSTTQNGVRCLLSIYYCLKNHKGRGDV